MNRVSIFLILIVAIILGLTAWYYSSTEAKQVPDVRWNENYNLYSEEVNGYRVFLSMLQKYFGADNIEMTNQIPEFYKGDSTRYLIMVLGDPILESSSYDSWYLADHVEGGNHVLFLGNSFKYIKYSFDSISVYTHFRYINDWNQKGKTESVTIYPENYSFALQLNGYTSDTTHQIGVGALSTESNEYIPTKLMGNDSLDVFITLTHKEKDSTRASGGFYFHGGPIYFSNIAALQPWYSQHFNFVFSPFQDCKVILVQENQSNNTAQSPLEILLANRGLKYAYYTFLIGVFIFIAFESKRILTPLPIIREKQNMSFAQIKTLARLHEVHGNNYQLAKKMRENFLFEINNLFQIQPVEKDMPEALAKKSGLEKKWIENLFQLFDHIKLNQRCSDATLKELHDMLQTFHKKIK